MRKINESNDIKNPNTNELLKFYYTMLKERQSWLMSMSGKNLKKIAVLMLSNTAILMALIIILLCNQLPSDSHLYH